MPILSLTQLVGFLNILAGLMLTVSLLLMGAGIIMWFARLGTVGTYRDEAIEIMHWAVAVLFSLILILLVVQFIQHHTRSAVYLLGFVILGIFGYALLQDSGSGGEKKEGAAH